MMTQRFAKSGVTGDDDEEKGCYALFQPDEEGRVVSPGSTFRMNTAAAAVASGGCAAAPVSVHKAGLPGYADDSDYGQWSFFPVLGITSDVPDL